MTTTTLSQPADVSAFSFVQDAIKGFRRSRPRRPAQALAEP